MSKLLSLTAACSLFAAPAAFAVRPQTHHCELNGNEVSKTKKACKKAGGKWAKGAPNTSEIPSAATPSNTSRSPDVNKALPANTPPTPNDNNPISPPPGERTPGN